MARIVRILKREKPGNTLKMQRSEVVHLNGLAAMVRQLDSDCPWCKEQSGESILAWLHSEASEVGAALESNNDDHLEDGWSAPCFHF